MNEIPYFYITRRKRKKRNVLVACFPDLLEEGKTIEKSVEGLRKKLGIKDHTPITRKAEATIIAQRAYEAGFIVTDKRDPLFVDYILSFWDFDKSDFIRRKNIKNPNSIGREYAKSLSGTFRKNAVPLLPKNLKLSEVKTSHIDYIVNMLIDDGVLANATITRVIQSMSVPLKEAKRTKKIAYNPILEIESLSNRVKERGILTSSELQNLINWMYHETQKKNTITLGNGEIEEYDAFDLKVYLATLLAVYTGMRQGEIRGLRKESIKLVNEEQGIITVSEAIAVYSGTKTTKGKRDRQVPVPRWLCEELLQLESMNPYDNGFVFWSKTASTNPISSSYIRKHYYCAMGAIGIGEADRISRNINFHSLRHYYVTYMNGKVDKKTLKSVIGHQEESTTAGYTHETS
jgi:integrase